MLRRLRRGFRYGVRRTGLLLVTLVAFTALVLGAHAALDWHRHGESGTGFFHLHVHVGHHHHGESHHHDHEKPEPPTDKRRECGTLTLAFGVSPAPAVAAVEKPTLDIDDRAPGRSPNLTDRRPVGRSWSPRAPPSGSIR